MGSRGHYRRVGRVVEELRQRLASGYLRAGDRFPSNRALMRQYEISYQTAHRVVAQLCAEGRLVRRQGSGTYVAGESAMPEEVVLYFHPRAQREGSVGALLLDQMESALRRSGVTARVEFQERIVDLPERVYPVVWECEVPTQIAPGRYRMNLMQRPPHTAGAAFVDSVTVDDLRGGIVAGELLRDRFQAGDIWILASRSGDDRNDERVRGCRFIFPNAKMLEAGSWNLDTTELSCLDAILAEPLGGVFAVNDRLASQLLQRARETGRPVPHLVGFDNAPVSREMGFSTIAIPWDELVENAIEVISRRLAGAAGAATARTVIPRAVVRGRLVDE